MDIDKIKKIVESYGESYIFKIEYLNSEYVQTLKLEKGLIKFKYYKIEKNWLHLEQNKEIYEYLTKKYELLPSDIMYRNSFEEEITTDTKIADNEKKEWVKKFAGDTLDGCKLFADVYGKNFASERMKTLENFYIGGYKGKILGCQAGKDIILFKKNNEAIEYTLEGLKHNKELQQTILHEAIHLILRRKKIKKVGIKPTGTIMYLESKEGVNEIGRYFNEGLTEWITEKCGCDAEECYIIYKTLIYELELALGPKNVMKLGKCKNLNKILKMTDEEIFSFLSKFDKIDVITREIYYLIKLEDKLKNEDKELALKRINQKISKNEKFKLTYDVFLTGEKKEHSYENFMLFCEKKIELLFESGDEIIYDIENTIYEKYFKKQVQFALNYGNPMPKNVMQKYTNLVNLIKSIKGTSSYPKNLNDFILEYGIIQEKYINSILEDAKKDTKMTKSDFLGYLNEMSLKKMNCNQKKITRAQYALVEQMLIDVPIEDRNTLKKLFTYIYENGNIGEIEEYSVKKLTMVDGTETLIYYKNGKIVTDDYANNDGIYKTNNVKNLKFEFEKERNEKMMIPFSNKLIKKENIFKRIIKKIQNKFRKNNENRENDERWGYASFQEKRNDWITMEIRVDNINKNNTYKDNIEENDYLKKNEENEKY